MSVKETRAHIKKYFPMGSIMSRGNNTPISVYSIDPLVFRTFWSLKGEAMVAEGSFDRSLAEHIAKIVSINNSCRICITAHAMMETAAGLAYKKSRCDFDSTSVSTQSTQKSVQKSLDASFREKVLDYAKAVHKATIQENDDRLTADFPNLDNTIKAEIAMVVFLNEHMNRVTKIIFGDTLSSAMLPVPKKMAKALESKRSVRIMTRLMAPILKHRFKKRVKGGFTGSLFGNEALAEEDIPVHMRGILHAGKGRAASMQRWIQAVHVLPHQEPLCSLVNDDILKSVQEVQKQMRGVCLSPKVVSSFLDETVQTVARTEQERAIILALIMTQNMPGMMNQSIEWQQIQKTLGRDCARLLVIWWSMKITLDQAKGLE